MFFFAPVIGGIADKYGRSPALKISMLGLTVGFLICTLGCYWSSLFLLILGRIVSGITAGSFSVAQAAIADISSVQNKAFNLSLLVLANCMGFSCGPMLGGIFVHGGVGPIGVTTFLIGILMSLLGFVATSFFFKEVYIPSQSTSKLNIVNDFLNIKVAFKKSIVNYYLWSFLFSMVGYGLIFSNIPVFLHRQFNSSSSVIGFVLSGFIVVLSCSLMLGGRYIFKFYNHAQIVKFAQAGQIVLYLLIALCLHSLFFNCVLFACIAFTVGLMYVGLLTLISDETAQDWQGRMMGVVASLFSLTWGLGPFLAGSLNALKVYMPFLCAALLAGLGLLYFRFIKQIDASISSNEQKTYES